MPISPQPIALPRGARANTPLTLARAGRQKLWLALLLFAGPALLSAVAPGRELAALIGGVAIAQQQEKRQVRRDAAMDAKVHKKLAEAQELTEQNQYAQAVQVLEGLRNGRKKLNGYEAANVWNLYGFIYYAQENYSQAQNAYQTALRQPDLPIALESALRYTLSQLHFLQEQYRDAINMLLSWIKITNSPGAEPHVLLAQAYYNIDQIDQALASITKAFEWAQRSSAAPKESWYQLLVALHFQKQDYRSAIAPIRQLIMRWPHAKYWLQLSGIYGELENEPVQLAVLETAYMQGMLSREQEIVNLASLLLNNKAPWQGAKILEKAMQAGTVRDNSKNLHLLSVALYNAEEIDSAMLYLERAAKKSDEADFYVRLARMRLDRHQFQKSIEAAQAALKKSGLKRPDDAWMVIGISYFEAREYEESRKAFHRVAQTTDKKHQKTVATQWLQFVTEEERKERELKAALAAL